MIKETLSIASPSTRSLRVCPTGGLTFCKSTLREPTDIFCPYSRLIACNPSIIHWEVKHLSTPQREECLDRLAGFGYRFAPSGDEDMLAVLDAHHTTERVA